MKLWLDDERQSPEGWYWVKNPWRALGLIRSGLVEEVSLDHDLGREETGYWLLCHIERDVVNGRDYALPAFTIHSANPVGRKNMKSAIASIERWASRV